MWKTQSIESAELVKKKWWNDHPSRRSYSGISDLTAYEKSCKTDWDIDLKSNADPLSKWAKKQKQKRDDRKLEENEGIKFLFVFYRVLLYTLLFRSSSRILSPLPSTSLFTALVASSPSLVFIITTSSIWTIYAPGVTVRNQAQLCVSRYSLRLVINKNKCRDSVCHTDSLCVYIGNASVMTVVAFHCKGI